MKKQSTNTSERDQIKKAQHISDLAATNVDAFRAEATIAFNTHSKSERALLKGLNVKDVDSSKLLAAWETDVLALNHKLDNKLNDETFKTSLLKNLFLSKKCVDAKLMQLIFERKTENLNEFILKFYPINKKSKKDVFKKQRRLAKLLLLRPEEEILQLKNHQADYIAYLNAAAEHDIAIVDPCDTKANRKKIAQQIESEQRQVLNAENDRLYEIKNRLNSLSAMSGGVLIDILDKKWELDTVLELRSQYEKAISKLSKKDSGNAIKRLEIFDKVTNAFRNEQTTKLEINAEQVSLATARTITKDIDGVLLRVFDLTEVQKDQLINNAKEYHDLNEEQSAIINKQNIRSKHL